MTLSARLEATAAAHGERLAVSGSDGDLTYAQLRDQAARVAGFLGARGIGPGHRVALYGDKTAAQVAAIHGILRAGAAYVPIPPTAPADRARFIATDCTTSLIFADGPFAAALADAGIPIVSLVAPPPELTGAPPAAVVPVAPADLAYLLYTSGSTGRPKGVVLRHENGTSFVDWCVEAFVPGPADRFSSHAPFSFDLSILDLFVPVQVGASVHLIDDQLGKSPKDLAAWVTARALTIWYSTPSVLTLLVEHGKLEEHPAPSLRTVLFAGEVFPVRHLRRVTELWPHPAYYNLYGPTETNVCTFARVVPPIPPERTEPYPIGPACSHYVTEVWGEDGRPVAPGAEGLLHGAGPGVCAGYWRDGGVFDPAVVRDGVRFYNTGDVVREDPALGYIYLGRRDRMVKRRGYRIELGEVEVALLAHEQVLEAAVISHSSPSGVSIVAFVRGDAAANLGALAMKQHLAKRLPAYMMPDRFVRLDAFPRTSSDKTDLQALARRAADLLATP